MKTIYHILIITSLLIFSDTVFSQNTYTVDVANFSFTPTQLTINVGDIVKWTNLGGFHNVVADDNSFTSGVASTANWVYEFVFNSVGTFPYYCVVHGGPGGSEMSGVITVEAATDVTDKDFSIDGFELNQNYPNPFNPSTTISYHLPITSQVTLKVYDVIGNEVATLVNEEKPAGKNEVSFNASSVPGGLSSGIYFYKLQAGTFFETKEMVLLK